jgi:hypothetical protein
MINNRAIVIYIITASICAGISFFGILPNLSKSLGTIKQIGLSQKKLASIAQEKQILANLSKNENLEKLLTFAVNAIPDGARANELTTELNSLVQNTGMTLNNKIIINDTTKTGPNNTNNSGQSNDTNFSFNITGDFASIIKVLTLSEKTSRLISIKNINLAQASNNKITAQIGGTAYWTKINTSNIDDITKYEVSTSTIKKLQSLTEPEIGLITPAETGFGRLEPFSDIKK